MGAGLGIQGVGERRALPRAAVVADGRAELAPAAATTGGRMGEPVPNWWQLVWVVAECGYKSGKPQLVEWQADGGHARVLA